MNNNIEKISIFKSYYQIKYKLIISKTYHFCDFNTFSKVGYIFLKERLIIILKIVVF